MIVNPSVLGEFGSQVRKERVREVSILGGDLRRSLFGYQAGYLRSTGWMDICIERGRTEGRNVNYKGFMFQIKCCSCKLFLSH